MPQIINTNIMSLNTQRALNMSQQSMATSLERLSSGLRINRASDDAAGLGVSENMTKQIRGLQQAIRNVNDGVALAAAGEASLSEVSNMLHRMTELNVQKANGTYSADDKANIDIELGALKTEITDQLASKFNGISLFGGTITIADDEAGGTRTIGVASITAVADTTQASVDATLKSVITARATFGSDVNSLESRSRYLAANVESLSSARSQIRDADFALETSNLTRTQILQQAGTAMLAQANALPQSALSLLR